MLHELMIRKRNISLCFEFVCSHELMIWRWPFRIDFSATQTTTKYHPPPSRIIESCLERKGILVYASNLFVLMN